MNIVRPVRVKFAKRGSLIYISHLDLTRTFTRVFMRAGLPVWYTEGFNPHPRFNFALPLSVGVSSKCEFLDMKFVTDMSDEEARVRLTAALPPEIEVLEVYTPDTKFTSVTDAEYEIRITSGKLPENAAEKTAEMLTAKPLVVLKRTKSGEKDTDISPFISHLTAGFDSGVLTVNVRLSAASESYLNPEYLVDVIEKGFGLGLEDDITSQVDIARLEVYSGDKKFR